MFNSELHCAVRYFEIWGIFEPILNQFLIMIFLECSFWESLGVGFLLILLLHFSQLLCDCNLCLLFSGFKIFLCFLVVPFGLPITLMFVSSARGNGVLVVAIVTVDLSLFLILFALHLIAFSFTHGYTFLASSKSFQTHPYLSLRQALFICA